MDNTIQFSFKLKRLRKSKHMTQEQLSQELHIARPTITKYEAGDRMPTTENLSIIANYFGVTIDDLAGIKTDIKEAPLGSLTEEE